jgi:phosphonate transport system substrate-binding protein
LSVVAEHWLELDFGLVAGSGYRLVEASNHSTAIRAVVMGDADAAFGSRSTLQQMPPEIRDQVEAFDCRLSIPHQFTLVHPRLGAPAIEVLRAALMSFPETAAGRSFFAAGGFQGYVPLTLATVEAARPSATLVEKMIRSTP